MQARVQLESGRTSDVGATLDAAEAFLSDATPEEKAPILAQIRALRTELSGQMTPEDRTALAAAHGKIRQARSAVDDDNFYGLEDTLRTAESFLAEIRGPHAAEIAAARADIEALRARGRSTRPWEMSAASGGAPAPMAPSAPAAPVASAHVAPASSAPVAHAQATPTAAPVVLPPVTWEAVRVRAVIPATWPAIEAAIAGWEHEAIALDARPLDEPRMPKTREAVARIGAWLRDPATLAGRSDPRAAAAYRSAEEVFDTAAAQLQRAYGAVLTEAEALPAPVALLDRPNALAIGASRALHGTTYRDAVIARACALGARWEAAVLARADHARIDPAIRAATAAWPAIMQRTEVQPELDPTKIAARDKTVLLSGVRNRAGWELGGAGYDFAALGAVPLGGVFAPHVAAEIERARVSQRLELSDRTPWDVIAVVEGPGEMEQRTLVTLVDAATQRELGEIEEWRPVACVRLQIIALRAGPLAIGP